MDFLAAILKVAEALGMTDVMADVDADDATKGLTIYHLATQGYGEFINKIFYLGRSPNDGSNGISKITPYKAIFPLLRNCTDFHDEISSLLFERNENILDVDCEGIMKENGDAVKYTKKEEFEAKKSKLVLSDEEVSSWTTNCTTFRQSRNYITVPISVEEEEYPLAYIISLYTNIQAFEHLLRSIYHPQNVYCIHVDQKSPRQFQRQVADIVRCFENVFFATKMVKVYYTHWSIVQSSLNCMEDLVRVNRTWEYVMNLCAFDYPIKTNLGIVRALKQLDGKNAVTSYDFRRFPNKKIRYTQKYSLPRRPSSKHVWLQPTGAKKDPTPHNITIFTGSDYVALKREAVEYLLQDQEVQDFFEWAKDTLIPDELIWPTLQRMYPKFPGSVPPDTKHDMEENDAIVRFRSWGGKCAGKFVRAVCVFASGDLHRFVNDKHIFANKVGFKVDPVAIECLAEHLRNKTIKEAMNHSPNSPN